MADNTERARSWPRVAGRFALALLLIIVSGSLANAGAQGLIPAVLSLTALGVLVWAVVGVVHLMALRRALK